MQSIHIGAVGTRKDRMAGSMTGEQVRMAKAALGISNPALAERTGLHRNTINRAEKGEGRPATFDHLRRFFEAEGVRFLGNGDVATGPGVSLSTHPDSDSEESNG